MSVLAFSSALMPGIEVPDTIAWGLVSNEINVCSSHTIVLSGNAFEYRSKPATDPALRLTIPAKLGPVRCRSGATEWQGEHRLLNVRAPF